MRCASDSGKRLTTYWIMKLSLDGRISHPTAVRHWADYTSIRFTKPSIAQPASFLQMLKTLDKRECTEHTPEDKRSLRESRG